MQDFLDATLIIVASSFGATVPNSLQIDNFAELFSGLMDDNAAKDHATDRAFKRIDNYNLREAAMRQAVQIATGLNKERWYLVSKLPEGSGWFVDMGNGIKAIYRIIKTKLVLHTIYGAEEKVENSLGDLQDAMVKLDRQDKQKHSK